jgi:hypothetical protein
MTVSAWPSRYELLDGLRELAALGVVLHLIGRRHSQPIFYAALELAHQRFDVVAARRGERYLRRSALNWILFNCACALVSIQKSPVLAASRRTATARLAQC